MGAKRKRRHDVTWERCWRAFGWDERWYVVKVFSSWPQIMVINRSRSVLDNAGRNGVFERPVGLKNDMVYVNKKKSGPADVTCHMSAKADVDNDIRSKYEGTSKGTAILDYSRMSTWTRHNSQKRYYWNVQTKSVCFGNITSISRVRRIHQ